MGRAMGEGTSPWVGRWVDVGQAWLDQLVEEQRPLRCVNAEVTDVSTSCLRYGMFAGS